TYHTHHPLQELRVLAVAQRPLRVHRELAGAGLQLLAADHALLHEQGRYGGEPVLVVGGIEVFRLPHALDGVAKLVDVVDALDHADQVHHQHGLPPAGWEVGLVALPLHGPEAVLAAEIGHAIHDRCARMIPRGPRGVKRSASRQLHGVAELSELVGDAFAMIALDLYRVVLDRAARAPQAFELGCAGLEIFGGQSPNHRHHLALASRAIAEDAHHTVGRPA